jgi:hypothetical protein
MDYQTPEDIALSEEVKERIDGVNFEQGIHNLNTFGLGEDFFLRIEHWSDRAFWKDGC